MALANPFRRKGNTARTPAPLDHDARRRRMVITPEGVPIPFLLASRGARAGALFLDLAMIVGAMIGATLVLAKVADGVGLSFNDGDTPQGRATQALVVVWIIALFLFRNAWFLFFELGPRGATPGKRITGIRVAARARHRRCAIDDRSGHRPQPRARHRTVHAAALPVRGLGGRGRHRDRRLGGPRMVPDLRLVSLLQPRPPDRKSVV